jgi:hypothetical protein
MTKLNKAQRKNKMRQQQATTTKRTVNCLAICRTMQSFKHQHTKQCVIENNNNNNRFRHIALQSKGNLSYENSMRVQNS